MLWDGFVKNSVEPYNVFIKSILGVSVKLL